MKQFIVFAVSFIVLFIGFQALSGMIFTQFYTPDINEAWGMADTFGSEGSIVANGSSTILILLCAVLSASIAYFIPKTLPKKNN